MTRYHGEVKGLKRKSDEKTLENDLAISGAENISVQMNTKTKVTFVGFELKGSFNDFLESFNQSTYANKGEFAETKKSDNKPETPADETPEERSDEDMATKKGTKKSATKKSAKKKATKKTATKKKVTKKTATKKSATKKTAAKKKATGRSTERKLKREERQKARTEYKDPHYPKQSLMTDKTPDDKLPGKVVMLQRNGWEVRGLILGIGMNPSTRVLIEYVNPSTGFSHMNLIDLSNLRKGKVNEGFSNKRYRSITKRWMPILKENGTDKLMVANAKERK